MPSKNWEFNSTDFKKWLINIAKYLLLPCALYVLGQIQAGQEVDINVILTTAVGALIDFLHRFANDNTKPL